MPVIGICLTKMVNSTSPQRDEYIKRVRAFVLCRFPFRSRTLCEKWVKALKRKDFVPTKASLVCSDHFREEDYVERPGLTKRMLKKDAVPSIFNFPVTHLGGDVSQNGLFKKKKPGNPVRRKELIDMDNIDSVSSLLTTRLSHVKFD